MERAYESATFIVIDKPAGALTVPSRLGVRDERPCVGRELELALGARLWPVHRLDLDVSGLVVFAKSAAAHRAASGWFAGRDVRKVYHALTEGEARDLEPGSIREWRSRLVRGKRRAFEAPHGKEAVTRATFAGARGPWLAWRLEPLTGRPHQLRVHLAAHGFVVAGDVLYGATRPYDGAGIGLRAVELDLCACAGRDAWSLPDALRVAGLWS